MDSSSNALTMLINLRQSSSLVIDDEFFRVVYTITSASQAAFLCSSFPCIYKGKIMFSVLSKIVLFP